MTSRCNLLEPFTTLAGVVGMGLGLDETFRAVGK